MSGSLDFPPNYPSKLLLLPTFTWRSSPSCPLWFFDKTLWGVALLLQGRNIKRGICHHFPTDVRSTPSSAFCPPESYASSGVGSPPISGLLGPWDVPHSLCSVHRCMEPTGCLSSFQCASVWTKCHSSPCPWKGPGDTDYWVPASCCFLEAENSPPQEHPGHCAILRTFFCTPSPNSGQTSLGL